jgi:hypothetical protein
LRSRKISEKSRFNEENAAVNLQPKPVAEYTEEPPKGATLSIDGRGCVVRFLHKRATKRHFNGLRGPPVVGAPNATHEGIYAAGRPSLLCYFNTTNNKNKEKTVLLLSQNKKQ